MTDYIIMNFNKLDIQGFIKTKKKKELKTVCIKICVQLKYYN